MTNSKLEKKKRERIVWDYKCRIERLWNPRLGWGYNTDNTFPEIHLTSRRQELVAGLFSSLSSVLAVDELG